MIDGADKRRRVYAGLTFIKVAIDFSGSEAFAHVRGDNIQYSVCVGGKAEGLSHAFK